MIIYSTYILFAFDQEYFFFFGFNLRVMNLTHFAVFRCVRTQHGSQYLCVYFLGLCASVWELRLRIWFCR